MSLSCDSICPGAALTTFGASTGANGWAISQGNFSSGGVAQVQDGWTTFPAVMPPGAPVYRNTNNATNSQAFTGYQKNFCLKAGVTYTTTAKYAIDASVSSASPVWLRLRWFDGSGTKANAEIANSNGATSNVSGTGTLTYTPTVTGIYGLVLQASNYNFFGAPNNGNSSGNNDDFAFGQPSIACSPQP